MKLKKFSSSLFDPYIGPIVFIAIVVSISIFFYIPKLSHENKILRMEKEAEKTLNYLKKIRIYYSSSVIEKIKDNSSVKIDYNYRTSYMTIPPAATLVHDLALILPENRMKIKLYSNYPFPNRKDRVLDGFEKHSLKYFLENPDSTYYETNVGDDKKLFKVAIPDIMLDNSCVECHNSRKDSPKRDWEIGDVRGAISITMPFDEGIFLETRQINILILLFVVIILFLGGHYTYISFKRSKEYEVIKKELEDKVKDRTATLNNTVKLLNQYKKAVDFSAIVSKTDKNGIINYVNDEFIKISKYTQEELIGKSHNIIRHPDMPEEIFEDLWRTIKSKKIWKGELKNRAKDGESYYVATTIVPILNYKDEIEEYLAIRLDITAIVKAKMEAQDANESKSIFLANMSHEIRTPLNAIIGFSEILSNNDELNIQIKKQLKIINSSASSLLSIINDILDVSKIGSGTFEIKIDNTDINFMSEQVIELFSQRANEKEVKLIFNLDHRVPLCVKSDGVRVKQVLSNLISNAIKFTPKKGSVILNIKVLSENENNFKVRFEVLDSGIGIPKDKLESIFNPFIQVNNNLTKGHEGTGLGLSICKYIVESLNSKIYIESEQNLGTKFWFDLDFEVCSSNINENNKLIEGLNFKVLDKQNSLYLHIENYLTFFGHINEIESKKEILIHSYTNNSELEKIRVEYKDIPRLILVEYEHDARKLKSYGNEYFIALPFYSSKVNDAIQELISSKSYMDEEQIDKNSSFEGTILVAEDNIANQELISYILNSVNLSFDIKNNGKEAIEAYKQSSYDLIFMDINMPIMDGLEAFKQIREYEKYNNLKNTPVIALTANSIKGDKEKFLELGMDDYLTKPINSSEIRKIFNKYLKASKNEKSIAIEPRPESYSMPIDINRVSQKLGISENVARTLAVRFKNEIAKEVEELKEAIENEDLKEIRQSAHYIKNSCLNVCLDDLCQILQMIEDEKSSLDESKKLFKRFTNELERYL